MEGKDEAVGVDPQDGGTTQCLLHPFRGRIPPGGICAFCLQKKLGDLVISSPFPIHSQLPHSSSPSPPSRSGDNAVFSVPAPSSSSLSLPVVRHGGNNKMPFTFARRKRQKPNQSTNGIEIVFRRSKSTVTHAGNYSPRKRRGFWSFLHLPSSYHASSSAKLQPNNSNKHKITYSIHSGPSSSTRTDSMNTASDTAVDGVNGGEYQPPSPSSFSSSLEQRKVSRSRSVGCGSRSFSGDFFERISNGFGDCTLRRVESQREGKSRGNNGGRNRESPRDRVRYCGGIFAGFVMASSSSSYHHQHQATEERHGRSRSWGWALASPVRALTAAYHKPSTSSIPKDPKRCRGIVQPANATNLGVPSVATSSTSQP